MLALEEWRRNRGASAGRTARGDGGFAIATDGEGSADWTLGRAAAAQARARAEAEWDGTIYNPSKMSHDEFVQAICPSVDRVRGIREVFYQHQPFADNANPTKAEVDEWHRIAINHLRSLIGSKYKLTLPLPDVSLG
jgi:hypothetical protein